MREPAGEGSVRRHAPWGADARRLPRPREDRMRGPSRMRTDERTRSPPHAHGARARWHRRDDRFDDRRRDRRDGWYPDRKRRYRSPSPDRGPDDRRGWEPRRDPDPGRVLPRKTPHAARDEPQRDAPPRSLRERLGDPPTTATHDARNAARPPRGADTHAYPAPGKRPPPLRPPPPQARDKAASAHPPAPPGPPPMAPMPAAGGSGARPPPPGPPPRPPPPRGAPGILPDARVPAEHTPPPPPPDTPQRPLSGSERVRPPFAEPDEAYEIVDQVGEGTYGQVYKASAERTGALVALKKIRMEAIKEGFPVTSMREIKLLQSLRHENVIRLHEIMTSRAGSVYMVFEYMEHDLNGVLVHPEVAFTDAHKKSLAAQLLHGLAYLHRRAVLHRDLKGSNLLLNNAGILKIADFGLARTYYKRHQGDYTNRVVTLWYRPPELLLGATQYGPEVDTWGAGCLFLELFTRRAVFQGHDEIHQLHVITQTLGPLAPDAWPSVEALPWFELMRMRDDRAVREPDTHDAWTQLTAALSPAATHLARGLLTYDPSKRWTATHALESPYFTTEDPRAEPPAGILTALRGEWHEMQAKRARKKARRHVGP